MRFFNLNDYGGGATVKDAWYDRITAWVPLTFSVVCSGTGTVVRATYTVPALTRAVIMSMSVTTGVNIPGGTAQSASARWTMTPAGLTVCDLCKVVQNDTGAARTWTVTAATPIFLGAGDLIQAITVDAPGFTFKGEGGVMIAEYSP